MFERISRVILISIPFLLSIISYSQGLGNSPYSSIGIGDVMNYTGNVRNMGMGNAGSAFFSKEYVNILNPAGIANLKYHRNDSLTKYEVGMTLQYKFLTNGQATSDSWGANVKYLAYSFPVSKVYSTAISITPLSSVQNYYSYTSSFPNALNYMARYTYNGSGGIYQLQWANGIGVTKNISIGLATNFNFGTITQSSTTQLITDPYNSYTENTVGIQNKTNYSGLSFKPGIIFSKQFSNENKNTEGKIGMPEKGIRFNFGATVEFNSTINSKQTVYSFVQNTASLNLLDSAVSQTRAPAYLPSVYRIGIGLQKPNQWTLAADLVVYNWSSYSKNQFNNDSYYAKSSFNLCVGAERQLTNQKRFTRSNTIRTGFMLSSTPLLINGETVYDYSFSIGGSLPVGVKKKEDDFTGRTARLPALNIALVVGQRSSPGSIPGSLTETYYRLNVSMLIYQKWFNKRRIQ